MDNEAQREGISFCNRFIQKKKAKILIVGELIDIWDIMFLSKGKKIKFTHNLKPASNELCIEVLECVSACLVSNLL
jgi:hypothetical protein